MKYKIDIYRVFGTRYAERYQKKIIFIKRGSSQRRIGSIISASTKTTFNIDLKPSLVGLLFEIEEGEIKKLIQRILFKSFLEQTKITQNENNSINRNILVR